MAYSKNTWATGDVITAEKLNSIENAVGNVSSSVDSMVPSVAKINNIEDSIDDINSEISSMAPTLAKVNPIESAVQSLSSEIASARNYNSSGTANTLGGRIDELVRISNTQPGGNNEIWVNSNSNTIVETQVPTYSEFEALRDSIAQEYSEGAPYSIGDYVTHEEQLYRCTTEITTAETWNDAHWTQVVFGSEVRDLKSALVSVNIPNFKLFLDFKVGAVSSSGIVANTKRIYSGVFYSGTGKHIRVAVTGNCRYTCPWYDNADGTGFHSGGNWKVAGEEFELVDNRYYRIYIANALADADEIVVNSAYSSDQYKNLIVYQNVDGIAEKITTDYVTPYYLNYNRYFGAYLIQGGGLFSVGSNIATVVLSNANRVVSNVIHLDPNKQYIVRGTGDFTRYLYNLGDDNNVITYNSSWIYSNEFALKLPGNVASSIRFCFSKQVDSEEPPISINDVALFIEPVVNDEVSVPFYWRNKMNTVVSSLNARAALFNNGITFAFLTDDHAEENIGNAPSLLKYIEQRTECKSILLGGDFIVDGETESEVVSKVMAQLSKYQDIFGVNVYPVAGNHDFGVTVRVPYPATQRLITTIPRMNSKCKTVSGWHVDKDYYVNYDEASNTYLLCLWSASGQTIQNDLAYAISFFDMLPENANVIVLTHIIWDTQEVITERAQALLNILDAVKTKTTYSNNIYNINVDYTDSTTNIVCVLCGHIHKDKSIVTTGGIPVISTISDAYKTSAAGTTGEQAFDVVQVDYDNSKIYMTRIGSGNNRTFNF